MNNKEAIDILGEMVRLGKEISAEKDPTRKAALQEEWDQTVEMVDAVVKADPNRAMHEAEMSEIDRQNTIARTKSDLRKFFDTKQ